MTEVAYLYRLTSPSGRAYIGIAKNVRKRWQEHGNASRCGSKCALHSAIRKYGFENFIKEILVKSYIDYIKDLEVKAIVAYSTMVPAGYNMTAGGDGTFGRIVTAAEKQRISLAQKGRTFTEDHKLKLSLARKGKTMSDNQKQKIQATLKAIPRKLEWGKNISKAKKGVSQTEEARKIRAESQKLKWADPEYKTRQLELQRLGIERKRQRSLLHAA
jgi:group I intron endonuclease